MAGYKDMTFCTFYKDCAEAKLCTRPLTKKIKQEAKQWSDGLISQFLEKPPCHKPK